MRKCAFTFSVVLIAGLLAVWQPFRSQSGVLAEPSEKSSSANLSSIDKLVLKHLDEASIKPSAVCTDEEFVRRVYLDVCGLIPTMDQFEKFIADTKPDKRARLIRELLNNPQHAEAWSIVWNDLLRVNNSKPYRDWIRTALKSNMPYDQFARELISASGDAEQNPATNFYLRDEGNHVELVNSVSSAFMGTRMACAQCHDHPFAKWTQDDFHNLMAFFVRTTSTQDPIATLVKTEDDPTTPEEVRKLLKPYFEEAHQVGWKVETRMANLDDSGPSMGLVMDPGPAASREISLLTENEILKQLGKSENKDTVQEIKKELDRHATRVIGERATGDYRMPENGDAQNRTKTNEIVPAIFPWTEQKFEAAGSRRKALAEFVTGSRQFAQVQVNRTWAHLLGHGIVDPIDDFREKNLPSNPELLDYLTDEFIRSKFDNQHVLELILNSETYQRSSQPNESNRRDSALFSHQRVRRLTAEQMYDSILIATGNELGKELPGQKPIQRAADMPVPAPSGSFLSLLNQPNREETIVKRVEDGSVPQALELMNGPTLNNAIRTSPLAHLLETTGLNTRQIGAMLFEAALSRQPTQREQGFLAGMSVSNRREWIDDLYWALLNSEEFTYIK
jgi:hypothetical protein